jgi:hypothetical protein
MNPEKQQIAIAEALGWKNPQHPDAMKFKQGWIMPEKWWLCPKGALRFRHNMPDYLNDLNAMHEAEKVLTTEQREFHYPRNLGGWVDPINIIYATAAQRAEAFLRTLNLWKP